MSVRNNRKKTSEIFRTSSDLMGLALAHAFKLAQSRGYLLHISQLDRERRDPVKGFQNVIVVEVIDGFVSKAKPS